MTDSISVNGSMSSGSDIHSSIRDSSGHSSGIDGSSESHSTGMMDGGNDLTENMSLSRIRVVRLQRPNSITSVSGTNRLMVGGPNTAFGFSVRGGREFGTGFFVSRIEKGSEADIKGLNVGDQIIRVNGYHVDDAVHKELTRFISSQDRITLKVRGVGMLPVKDRSVDPLTWHIVPIRPFNSDGSLLDEMICHQDVRIILNVAPKTKLGLGICKGPEWKPGIFVQFTKEMGVAREAGLRPGDQLLSCNNIDFTDILFSEAVVVMKSSHRLELIIRTGAGIDLFPGESSGYNSSASSVTGDQSPCWGDQSSKRLSMVREEDGIDKINYLRPRCWERKDLDRRKDRLLPVDTPKIPIYNSSSENYQPINKSRETPGNNTTIIKLSENGTVINNTLLPKSEQTIVRLHNPTDTNILIKENSHIINSCKNNINVNNFVNSTKQPKTENTDEKDNSLGTKLADICFVSRQSETKTVIVEVHRSTGEQGKKSNETVPPPPPPVSHNQSPSATSSLSMASGASLSSAISEELKKRAQRTKSTEGNEIKDLQSPGNGIRKIGNSIVGKSDDQHNALMNEFKRAHKKMFKNGFTEIESNKNKMEEERQSENRRISLVSNRQKQQDETDNTRISSSNELSSKSDSYSVSSQQSSSSPNYSPPISPLPDYDSLSPSNMINYQSQQRPPNQQGTMGRCAAAEHAKATGDTVEMESIESYQLTNPAQSIPRPPSLYFNPQSSGPPTMKKNKRSVSVTIGEYAAAGGQKKEPSKFDFINNTRIIDTQPNNGDVSDQLRSELEKTLSRSNLKKKTEIPSSNLPTNKINENQSQSTKIVQKPQSNVEKIASMLSNQSFFANKTNGESFPKPIDTNNNSKSINGILKNSNGIYNTTPVPNNVSSINGMMPNCTTEHRNISFGKVTTVIAER